MSRDTQLARRDFLVRSAKAGAAIVAAGGAGLWLHDPQRPVRKRRQRIGVPAGFLPAVRRRPK